MSKDAPTGSKTIIVEDRRTADANRLAAWAMEIVSPYITDVEGAYYAKAKRALWDSLFEADIEYTTAYDRKVLRLRGWSPALPNIASELEHEALLIEAGTHTAFTTKVLREAANTLRAIARGTAPNTESTP